MKLKNVNILFITNKYKINSFGGRESLSLLLLSSLKKIFNNKIIIYYLNKKKINIKNFHLYCAGYIDGLNQSDINKIKSIINKDKIRYIIINGSSFGKLVQIIKKKFKKCIIITFYHNVEFIFFLNLFKYKKTLKSFIIFLIQYFYERKSSIFSDYRICLTKRDSQKLNQIFKNKKNFIIPLSIQDKLRNFKTNELKDYLLFVGGNFYGNVHGISWFIKNVMTKIESKLVIIGKGMNKINLKTRSKKIYIYSKLKDLSNLYLNSKLVIAPIFFGSGMKTKIAEAAMYGKVTLGTNESFIGYEKNKKFLGYECNNADEFINKINFFNKKKIKKFNTQIRKIYLTNYSELIFQKKIKKILQNII